MKRVAAGVATLFVYDEAGQLLGQYDSLGQPLQQYLRMDSLPVGVIAGDQLLHVQSDHLGTPRAVIDPTRNVPVWTWPIIGEAFGATAPNEDPDLDGTGFAFDLRFPGQRYDSASGLNQNYFRDYESLIGRYPTSDPVGLAGGWATYGYVIGDPLNAIDPSGLIEVHGYQNRGGGNGWFTQYELRFKPLSAKPGVAATKAGKMFNRLGSIIDFLDTDPAGPKSPYKDYIECGQLDAKLQKEYESYGYSVGQRLTHREALDFLNAAYTRHAEMRDLYSSPMQMLRLAEDNSKDHWFYRLRPGE